MSSRQSSGASTRSNGSGAAPSVCPSPTPPAEPGRLIPSVASARHAASRGFDALGAVVLAAPCAACAEPLDRWRDGPVCPVCWAAVRLLAPPVCRFCGAPRASARPAAEGRCPRCPREPGPLSRVGFAGIYDGALRAILHAYKYDRRPSLARRLAALMRLTCAEVLEGADGCVPVPLHWRRRWQRGFNQADELARRLGLPVLVALRRTRPTLAQASLHAHERQANVRGAFRVRRRFRGGGLDGLSLVLVDDVMTTGATLRACALALREAGARDVRAVTAAGVVPGACR